VQKFRTNDGFEFETTRRPGVLRCVCRHGPDEAAMIITSAIGEEPGPMHMELIEMATRNMCIAFRRTRLREERRRRQRQEKERARSGEGGGLGGDGQRA
jgi:hypothetical protein